MGFIWQPKKSCWAKNRISPGIKIYAPKNLKPVFIEKTGTYLSLSLLLKKGIIRECLTFFSSLFRIRYLTGLYWFSANNGQNHERNYGIQIHGFLSVFIFVSFKKTLFFKAFLSWLKKLKIWKHRAFKLVKPAIFLASEFPAVFLIFPVFPIISRQIRIISIVDF